MTGIEQREILALRPVQEPGRNAGNGAGGQQPLSARFYHTIRFQQLSSTQNKSRSTPFSSSRVVWDTSSQ